MIWITTTETVTNDVASFTEDLRSSLVSEIGNLGKYIYPKTNLSTIGLARVIDSRLTNNDTSFSEIQTQVVEVIIPIHLFYLILILRDINMAIIFCCCCSDRTSVVSSLFNDPSCLTSFVH